MSKRIRVDIKGGKPKVTAEGYAGESCYEATKAVRDALGSVESDEKTEDYFKNENDLDLDVDA